MLKTTWNSVTLAVTGLIATSLPLANAASLKPHWACHARGQKWQCQAQAEPPVTHPQATEDTSALLGWTRDYSANLCHGYYADEPIPIATDAQSSTSRAGFFQLSGRSILSGKAVLTEPDKQLKADLLYINRDSKTGKLTSADAFGHVLLRKPGLEVIGQSAHVNIPAKTGVVYNADYRSSLYDTSRTPIRNKDKKIVQYKLGGLSIRGHAHALTQLTPQLYDIQQGSYTSCPPTSNAWKVVASRIVLDKKDGRGEAYNARFEVQGVPIFYAPYFNFPIDNRRQSGFLFPSYHYSKDNGFAVSTPYYLNLAPNYDTIYIPRVMTHRGLQNNLQFRYLTDKTKGDIQVSLLPHDRGFIKFKRDANKTYSPPNQLLERLNQSDDDRRSFTLHNFQTQNSHWSSSLDYNYVSDDYFMRDLGNTELFHKKQSAFADNEDNEEQLLRQGILNYKGSNWQFTGALSSHQTLHPVDMGGDIANEYAKLPSINVSADYPDKAYGLDYGLNTDYTQFYYHPLPGQATPPVGTRLMATPSVSLPLSQPYGYLTPRVSLYSIAYRTDHPLAGVERNSSRAIPTFNIDSGLYFDRNTKVWGKDYRQTLEPRLYYLYVPYRNQNRLPQFDTTRDNSISNLLFNSNRFKGVDRMGDANQATLGLTSRFYDAKTGDEKITGTLGQIYYFRDRTVQACTGNNCNKQLAARDTTRVSPLILSGYYRVNRNWHVNASSTLDTSVKKTTERRFSFQYHADTHRVFNLSYSQNQPVQQTIINGLPVQRVDESDLTKQLSLSLGWPLNRRWSLVGYWHYDLKNTHDLDRFLGLEYENCCWGVRMLTVRHYQFTRDARHRQYDNGAFVQFVFKGLGQVGRGAADSLIANNIPGYQSRFQ